MKFKRIAVLACVFGLTTGLTGNLKAQFSFPGAGAENSGITAVGSETIQAKPIKIRLVMWIKAEGADAKEAVKSLAVHRVRVKEDLLAMKAEEASIQFSDTRVSSGGGEENNAYMRMQMMQMAQMNGGKPQEMPQTFVAKAAVKAEWQLPGTEGDALALVPETLKLQIKARDLAGEENKAKLDPGAMERAEEMATMMQNEYGYYSEASGEATGPQVVFVATVTPEQVQQATKAAFDQAVGKVKHLSAATGIELGKLNTLVSSEVVVNPYEALQMASYGYGATQVYPQSLTRNDSNTIVGANPGELTKEVSVVVNFTIGQ